MVVLLMLYLVEFLHKADLLWWWPPVPEDTSFEDLKEEEPWFPQVPPPQQFLIYARDQR